MIPWFRDFYKVMQESGLDLRWTAIGVVDADIASARSVIEWGAELQNTRGLRHCPQPFSGWCRVVLGESEAGAGCDGLSGGILARRNSDGRADGPISSA